MPEQDVLNVEIAMVQHTESLARPIHVRYPLAELVLHGRQFRRDLHKLATPFRHQLCERIEILLQEHHRLEHRLRAKAIHVSGHRVRPLIVHVRGQGMKLGQLLYDFRDNRQVRGLVDHLEVVGSNVLEDDHLRFGGLGEDQAVYE